MDIVFKFGIILASFCLLAPIAKSFIDSLKMPLEAFVGYSFGAFESDEFKWMAERAKVFTLKQGRKPTREEMEDIVVQRYFELYG